jgi:hypothetical protein
VSMTKDSAVTINQIIMIPCCAPFIFTAVNLLYPFFGLMNFMNLDGTFPDADFHNHHIMGLGTLLFAVPYGIVFLVRNDENIFFPTKIVVSVTLAVSLLDPFTTYYSQLYIVLAVLLSSGAMYGLYWKPVKKRHTDYGKYPLLIAPQKGPRFPTASLHENVHNAASRIMPRSLRVLVA